MKSYSVLNALPAAAFLDPKNFLTAYDGRNAQYAKEQYEKGVEIGRQAKAIHISAGTVWSASMKSGSALCSYEGIGYHACTADLLRGFLDSGAQIVVSREAGPDAGKTIAIK